MHFYLYAYLALKVFDKENKQRSLEPFHYCYSSYGSRLDYGAVVKLAKTVICKIAISVVQLHSVPPVSKGLI